MASEQKLTIQQLAELALFLAKEGAAYQSGQAGHPYHATVRYAQSLSVFRQLNAPNEAWISFVLHNLGNLKAQDHQLKHALAFLEAAAYVQQRLGENKDVADTLLDIGRTICENGAYSLAQRLFEQAARIYQAIGLKEQSDTLLSKIEKLKLAYDKTSGWKPRSLTDRPHEFEIQVYGQAIVKFTVTPAGEVQWSLVDSLNQPLALGLTDWDVVCVDN